MTTTVNIANIKVGMNVKELKDSGEFARHELARLTKMFKDAESATTKLARDQELLARAFRASGGAINNLGVVYQKLKEKYGMAGPAASVKDESGAHIRLAGSIGKVAAAYIGLQSAIRITSDYLKDSVMLAAKIETASISFEVLTKSAEGSTQIMKELRDLAKSTPIAFSDFAQAAKMLLGTRVAADQIKPTLSALAAISLGNTETFAGLAKAFSDVSAAGRLTGQEMLQFRNAGFNPLNEIARTTGKTMRELKLDMEEGRISFDTLSGSIQSAVGAGGLFEGMNRRLMNSIQGQFNQLKNVYQEVQIVIGNELLPTVRELTLALKEMMNPSDPGILLRWAQEFSFDIGAITAALRGGGEGLIRFLHDWENNYVKTSMAKFKQNFTAKKEISELGAKNKELSDEELKLIKRNKDAFLDKIRSANEEYEKSLFFNPRDDKSYEKAMLRRGAMGGTPQDRIAAERAIIQLSDANSRQQINAVMKQTSDAKERFDLERRMAAVRKQFPLLHSGSVEEYASLEKTMQMRAETIAQATRDRITLLQQERMAGKFDQSGVMFFDLINKEKEAYRQHIKELKSTMDAAAQSLFEKAKMKLGGAAEELNNKFNPTLVLRKELAQLDFMRQQNMITQQVFDKQAMELGQQAREAMGLLPNIAPALKEGSAEAYKFILEQNAKSQERWQIKKLNEEMLKELRTANQQNANAPRLAQAR